MKAYKVSLKIVDIIRASSEKEAEKIFWDRFDNSVWKANVEETTQDFCDNCNEYIDQIDVKDGSFGCPICKRDDCITTFYNSDDEEEKETKVYENKTGLLFKFEDDKRKEEFFDLWDKYEVQK